MLKIKILDHHLHRVECLFRPFINNRHLFKEIGIRFIVEGNDYDLMWIGDKTFANKARNFYDEAIAVGRRKLERIESDYVLFDGQDSASMVGSWDVFKTSKAKLFLKNTLYNDVAMYSNPSVMGRYYWGTDDEDKSMNYQISDIDLSKVHLSGTNWLSTVTPNWYDYKQLKKDIDVCALFQFPAKENWEFEKLTNKYYDRFREKCMSYIDNLPSNIKVAKLDNGEKLPIEEYYKIMSRSKIIIAPFGYGEIAPRDLESAMLGSILIKNDMSHINTIPNIYSDQTYVSVKWDNSDLEEKIDYILNNFEELQSHFVENMRRQFTVKYNPVKLVEHTYDWISKLEGFGTE